LSTSSLASPLSFREFFASFFPARECYDGFLIERSRKSGSPVSNEWYHNLFKALSWSIAAPINVLNLKFSTLFGSLMTVHKAMFDTIRSKVDQLSMRQAIQHQILNQLTLVSISQGRSSLQLEGATDIDNKIDVQLLPKSLVSQANFKFLDRSAAKNLLQRRTIDRFVKDPAKLIMNFESMMNDFVSNFSELFLAVMP
jgi:hypothetical protein